jgi:selenide, water dikinase
MGPGDLAAVLAPIPAISDERLLVGRETFDDAGVYKISDDLALVQTVDFFAPIVDDPFDFGQIAAANALSDIYAMGGEPITALAICAFPTADLPLEILTHILEGAHDKVHEAGAFIVGGHTVIDTELKFGLAVTGRAHPARLLTNAAAKVGDRLVLTKAIGTGVIATAAKRGIAASRVVEAMIEQMKALNRDASRAALDVGAKCATDITGFGLIGHASHIARASNVTLRIRADSVPIIPGAPEAIAAGAKPDGLQRNADYVAPLTSWGSARDFMRDLLCDPQTSGGLLVAVPHDRTADYLSRVPNAVEIGEVVPREAIAIVVD